MRGKEESTGILLRKIFFFKAQKLWESGKVILDKWKDRLFGTGIVNTCMNSSVWLPTK